MAWRLQEVLRSAVSRLGLAGRLAQNEALLLWSEVVGEKLAARTEARAVKEGVLVVSVPGSAWAAELSLLKQDVLDRLNERLGEGTIKDIRFRVARGDARPSSVVPQGGSGQELPALTVEEKCAIRELAAAVPVPSLSEAYARVMESHRRREKQRWAQGWRPCRRCGLLREPGEGRCPGCGGEA